MNIIKTINHLLGLENGEGKQVNTFINDIVEIFKTKYGFKPEKIINTISSQGEKLIILEHKEVKAVFNYKKEIIKEIKNLN